MNNVQLIGRITRDPDIKYSQSGTAYMGFVLAVNRKQKDANGQVQADFISCKVFGATAEFISRYIKKGYMISIEGEIQTGQYNGQDGQVHYTTDVMVRNCENLTPKEQSAPSPHPAPTPQYQNNGFNQSQIEDDGMPF